MYLVRVVVSRVSFSLLSVFVYVSFHNQRFKIITTLKKTNQILSTPCVHVIKSTLRFLKILLAPEDCTSLLKCEDFFLRPTSVARPSLPSSGTPLFSVQSSVFTFFKSLHVGKVISLILLSYPIF